MHNLSKLVKVVTIIITAALGYVLLTTLNYSFTTLIVYYKTNTSEAKYVPRIIHQSWKNKNLSKVQDFLSKTWKQCFPNYEYKLWTDEENENFITKHYPWFLGTYKNFTMKIMRVDSVRYFYMYHYGGIYSDLDSHCLQPFEHLLYNHSIVFGAITGDDLGVLTSDGHVQNNFFYSVPKHSFWLEMIHSIMEKGKGSRGFGSVVSTTGPRALMIAINDYRKRFSDIKIYPPTYFNPFTALNGQKRAPNCNAGGMTEENLLKCRNNFNNSYVIQYHFTSWYRDF